MLEILQAIDLLEKLLSSNAMEQSFRESETAQAKRLVLLSSLAIKYDELERLNACLEKENSIREQKRDSGV